MFSDVSIPQFYANVSNQPRADDSQQDFPKTNEHSAVGADLVLNTNFDNGGESSECNAFQGDGCCSASALAGEEGGELEYSAGHGH